jgi:hypothetical protein
MWLKTCIGVIDQCMKMYLDKVIAAVLKAGRKRENTN